MTRGVYAGSFDPVHLGHLAIVERAARTCDELFVVVSGNPDKPGALFDNDERRRLVQASTQHLGNVSALTHSGLTVELAAELGADFLLRGIGKEQATELEMAAMNLRMSGLPTVFLPPDGRSIHTTVSARGQTTLSVSST